jgi:hypothetical protein
VNEQDQLLQVINDAAQAQDWPLLAAGLAALLVPAGFIVAKKGMPSFVRPALDAVLALAKVRRKAPPPPKPGEKSGLEAVVDIREEKKP